MIMRKFKYIILTTVFSFIVFSCEQESVQLNPYPSSGSGGSSGSSGSANFAKFVTIGGGYTSGMMDGALHTFGQSHSLAKGIISVGFATVAAIN